MPFVREIIFLGTGTSSCVPNVKCLVGPGKNQCKVCLDAFQNPYSKNRRKNTSLLIRISESQSERDPAEFRNIVIDTGKSFYESTLTWFPYYDITRIDAVILTHPHADAILGLDDLRAWCKTTLPVYLDSTTMDTITSCFPYCVNKDLATGGGEVPILEFHTFSEDQVISLFGIDFIPLKVEHGEYSDGSPFYCYGYRFNDIVYISDCSKIPESTKAKMLNTEIMILDALRIEPHKSHFSISDAMQALRHFQPRLGLLTGFTHQLSHEKLTQLASSFLKTGKLPPPSSSSSSSSSELTLEHSNDDLSCNPFNPVVNGISNQTRLEQMIPAHDGLRICLPWTPPS